AALRAIRLAGAKGDITSQKAVVWSRDKNTPYTPSPLLHGGLLYFLQSNNALLSCVDAKSGKEHYARTRLRDVGTVYASLVGARDRVYVVGKGGMTTVVAHGSSFAVLAENELDDQFSATPALSGDAIYLRGHRYLYCVAAVSDPGELR
ncbi:hypothetical protein ACFL59_08580, partial [Planctomycetota bacterium]